MKILYVEDDAEARTFVGRALKRSGLAVDTADTAAAGFECARTGAYDALVLDVLLPDESGFSLLQRLRSAGIPTPVLFLTAQGEVAHRIEGLTLGADDYLPKPFAFAELLARLRAIARRGPRMVQRAFQVADLRVDVEGRRVERSGGRIDLTPKEFSLLLYLVENQGQTVSRAMITERVWGYGFSAHDNLIDVHVTRLRKKVDRDFETSLIHTVKGVGYVLEDRDGADPSGRG